MTYEIQLTYMPEGRSVPETRSRTISAADDLGTAADDLVQESWDRGEEPIEVEAAGAVVWGNKRW